MALRRRCRPFPSAAAGHACLLLPRSSSVLLLACFLLLAAVLAGAAAADCSASGGRDGTACVSLREGCANAAAFCFPSTLPDFEPREVGTEKKQESGHGKPVSFKMAGDGTVICTSVDMFSALGSNSGKTRGGEHGVVLCQAPLVPDNWMRTSSGMSPEQDDSVKDDTADHNEFLGASSMDVELSPPVLDWGRRSLFSASMVFLTVSNLNKESALHVYEPFSSDPQFFPYGSEDLVIEPGGNASIVFVYLPRLLGSSSAHIVLQTNFGGYIVQAKGVSFESPYLVEPMVGISIASDGCFGRNMSIRNPFDDALHVEEVAVWLSGSASPKQVHHAVCRFGKSATELNLATSSGRVWYTLGSHEAGVPQLDIRPHDQWEVAPRSSGRIVELRLSHRVEGKLFGAICMKLWNGTANKVDTVVLPIELDVHGREAYHDSTNSLSVYSTPNVACDKVGLIFSLSARNGLLEPVKILSVTEHNAKGPVIFNIKFMKGLLLFPGSLTEIAFINQTFATNMKDIDLNCNIMIETNVSSSLPIKIPCRNFFNLDPSVLSPSTTIASIVEDSHITKPALLQTAAADEIVLRNWRSHGSHPASSVLKVQELSLPVVEVGSHFSELITVHNPSTEPTLIQLILSSVETIDHCVSDLDVSSHTLSNGSPDVDTMSTRFGFSLSELATTEAQLAPFGSATLGPVIFRPASRCSWSTLALVRSNLSGVEGLPIRAYGGLHSIALLEGSEPVQKLEFSLEMATVRNLSSLLRTDVKCPPCNQKLLKEIYVKNTGDLPLDVTTLKVSGTFCSLGGFTVDNCKGFSLAPGDTATLSVSYQADFSSAVVQHDLELPVASGIFVITMTAKVPVCMLDKCRKSSFQSVHWKFPVMVVGAVCLLLLVALHVMPSSSQDGNDGNDGDYYVKIDNDKSKMSKKSKDSFLPQSSRGRSGKEQEAPEGAFIDQIAVHHSGIADVSLISEKVRPTDQEKKLEAAPLQAKCADTEEQASRDGNLSIRVAREKGRRRKKRVAGSALAQKLEVSSSHSGNSTPSSPLSPSISTPKQDWPLSHENLANALSRASDVQKLQKELGEAPNAEAGRASQAEIPASFGSDDPLPPPVLPITIWPAPGASPSTFLASSSPIAPHARAPGSSLSKDSTAKDSCSDDGQLKNEFTYDIWGDHFSANLLDGVRGVVAKAMLVASEGDSRSFFAREPQSLVMMPPAPIATASPGAPTPCDVTLPNEIK